MTRERRKRRSLASHVLAVLVSPLCVSQLEAQPALKCDAESFARLGLAATQIVSATNVRDDARAGPHCLLRGAVNERTGIGLVGERN
jgi:hypothetical protein